LRLEGSSGGIIVSQSLGIVRFNLFWKSSPFIVLLLLLNTDAGKATHIIRKVLLRQIAGLRAVLLVLAFAGASPSFAWSENNCGHICNGQHPQDKEACYKSYNCAQ
jgi:hypothetical protein